MIENYNTSLHSTLRITPKQAIESNPHYQDHIYLQNFKASHQQYSQQHISIGSKVRLRIKRQLFEKASKPTFTKNIHTVQSIMKNGI